jgi:L-asparaginase II
VSAPAVLARVVRSGVEESFHLGHVAVCDASGRLVASAGDPDRVVFARSSMKPVQAAVSLSFIEDDLTDEEIAVMCGSHNAEAIHVRTALGLLGRAGLDAGALRCPPAWPRFPEDARAYEAPAPEAHNCSGKHAGMILASVRAGLPVETYLEAEHPLQRAVLDAVVRFTGADPLAVGVDGCGVPVHALSLRSMATLFARLASGSEVPNADRATAAMRAAPHLVAGRNRVDTALMQTVPDVVAKEGAEGLRCAGAARRSIGVAVRVDDGSARASGPALLRVLRLLDVVGDEHLATLDPFARPPVLGGGRPVGALTSDFTLSSA